MNAVNRDRKRYIFPMIDKPNKSSGRSPVVLCILDGWGERAETENNAIALAETPNWDRLVSTVPKSTLDASAEQVGLPAGQMGNSEVGHMNLGAGRVVMQDLPRIDAAVADGSIATNTALNSFIEKLKATGGTCHLMGLLSPGGVHSHQDHISALARIMGAAGIPVAIHAFMDGRDTPPKNGKVYLEKFINDIAEEVNCRVATVIGRYYAMDRDNRWDRVEQAFKAIAGGQGIAVDSPLEALEKAYSEGQTDEFVLPCVVGRFAGMEDGDGIFMANFRADRAREILATFVDPEFSGFSRGHTPELSARLGLVEYSAALNNFIDCMFPATTLTGILGEIVSEAGIKQLRIAETEKYAHVTFFLNGGREAVFEGEERILIPSPDVATYDLQPEMSAPELTDKLIAAIKSEEFGLIVVNYANGDMVGHTGVLGAAIEAANTLDKCLGRLEDAILDVGGAMLVTADHGNCESMYDHDAHEPHTQHTLNVVPILLVGAQQRLTALNAGKLSDVAPTLLQLMGLAQPHQMTGTSLLVDGGTDTAAAQ